MPHDFENGYCKLDYSQFKMRVSSLLPVVTLLPSAFGQLHTLAKAKGKLFFGSATDNYEFKGDAPYKAILSDTTEFGQITPGNAQKWAYSEPTQGTFSFAGGDEVADLAEANGQLLRCHTLVWHSQAPDYSEYFFDCTIIRTCNAVSGSPTVIRSDADNCSQ